MTISVDADASDPQLHFGTLLVMGGDMGAARGRRERCGKVGQGLLHLTGAFILAAAGLLDGRSPPRTGVTSAR